MKGVEKPNTCPACSAEIPITYGKGLITGGGVWSGKPGGAVWDTTCKNCNLALIYFSPGTDFPEQFFWEEDKWLKNKNR
jgi:hypothetical protein